MKSLLKKTFVSVVALFTILATVPAPAFAQIWEPPAGPPTSFNAPPPIHEGIEGQAKFWTDFNSNFSIGALLMLTQGLLSSYAIADGKGVAATQFCLGSMEDIENSNFPFGTEFLDCITEEEGWGALGGGGGGVDGQDGQDGASLPDGSYYNEMLRWDLATSSWVPMQGVRIAYSGQGSVLNWIIGDFQNQVGSGLNSSFVNMVSSLRVDPALRDNGNPGSSLFNVDMQSITISSNNLKIQPYAGFQDPVINPGDVLVALDSTGKVGWGSSGGALSPGNLEGDILVWDGTQWVPRNTPLKISNEGSLFILPQGENVTSTFGGIFSYNKIPVTANSSGEISYVPSKIGMSGESIVFDGNIFLGKLPPLATEDIQDSELVRPLCYEIIDGGMGLENLSALVVDCQAAPEPGSIVAVGTALGLDWASDRAIGIEPVGIVDQRTRYLFDKPEGLNSINVIACGSGGSGGGGGAAKPSNVGSPSGGGGGGGSAGDCVQQSVNVVAIDQIEILVGNNTGAGQRGVFWVSNFTSGDIQSTNGFDGRSTILNFISNGSVVETISAAGGKGGLKGNWPGGLNQPFGAGGKGGFLIANGIDQSDGYETNVSYASSNGGTGYGTVTLGIGQTNPFQDNESWFNAIGYVSSPANTASNPGGLVHLGGRGGDGEFYSGFIPPQLGNIGGNSVGPFSTSLVAQSAGGSNWVSGGAGGQGGSNYQSHDNPDLYLRGWLDINASGCDMTGVPNSATWCNHGGNGARGGPGFVQLSW